jgi:hypothetical protein
MKLGWSNPVHIHGAGSHDYTLGAACDTADILYIDHNLDDGEYFLIEYRFPCGFDLELDHHSGDWTRDRSGAAIWHIDESGQQNINYQSEGIPQNGAAWTHYVVQLVESDGNWSLEKETSSGGNKGDTTDLFMYCNYGCGKGYKIDDTGLYMSDGRKFPEPSTKGWSRGIMYNTGISITVGAYDFTMKTTVALTGNDPNPNTFPWPDAKGLSPGDVPTVPPTNPPTAPPTNPPTKPPTPAPTNPPTNPPTPPPTILSTNPPTPPPTAPPTNADTALTDGSEINFRHSEIENTATYEAKFGLLSTVDDFDQYANKYGLSDLVHQFDGVSGMAPKNRQTELLEIPIDCVKRDGNFRITYTGVGKRLNAVKIKHCGWFVGNNAKFCPLLDQDPDRIQDGLKVRIWQVCQQECYQFTNCHLKG